MITLCTGALPKRTAVGVFQVIQYFRDFARIPATDNFDSIPDDIIIPAVRISIPSLSFYQEYYGSADNQIHLKIIDRNERSPKVRLYFGNLDKFGLISGDSRMSIIADPFKDIKRIEEYELALVDDPDVEYTLIKVCLEKMDITFAKWW